MEPSQRRTWDLDKRNVRILVTMLVAMTVLCARVRVHVRVLGSVYECFSPWREI